MEYNANYKPPSQHIIVAPTMSHTTLEWSREGKRSIRTKAVFTPGDLILNPNGCFTKPQWDQPTRFTLVAIQPSAMVKICDEMEMSETDVPKRFHFQNRDLSKTIRELIACFETPPYPLLEAQALERTLLMQLAQECSPQFTGHHKLSSKRLSMVKDMLISRIQEPLTLEEMAKTSGYSASRFLLLFRNATGRAPHQYMIQMRVEKAQRLLAHTSLPLSQVASECGFADQSHLNRIFKRHTSFTPRQFRKL